MSQNFFLGIILIIISGVFVGLFTLPLAKTPGWKFENIWGVGSLLALLLIPWPLAISTVNDLFEVYKTIDTSTIIITLLFGVCWGIGSIYWGKGISAVGMALGVTLAIGFVTLFGSIIPMLIFQPGELLTAGGIALMISIAIMIIGVLIISIAGQQKEKETSDSIDEKSSKNKVPFLLGFFFCMISGILSAGVNIGFIFGAPVGEVAASTGTPLWATGFAIWVWVFTGNFGVNLIYAIILIIKNNSFYHFRKNSRPSYWLWGIFMGVTWPGAMVIYGIAAGILGDFGAYVGFPMMLLFSIIAGNIAGVMLGEWKGTKFKSRRTMIIGFFVLLLAFTFLGYSNKLLTIN